ncbi:Alpha/beta hydrolase family protein [Candidatus Bealeia paramacronuclearis]|uniref:Alpha/beta hydrolase family protein n=2 Tax=Candidatus Bealeia paramacronuclearis TaxID=1921001 RepID=A0ABZ2C771_9PROT|nr:Alpha/beta hydrolase family protein [Candidatus Bealeia paramacronuclearis]
MVALDLGLHGKNSPSGIIAYSGAYIPQEKSIPKKTPILLVHGKEDTIVPFQASEMSYDILKGSDVQLHLLEKLNHSIDDRGLDLGLNFIQKNL